MTQKGDETGIARALFQRCLTRPPDSKEQNLLINFYRTQLVRFQKGEAKAEPLAGKGGSDVNHRAAWTALARVLLNTDEFITRN